MANFFSNLFGRNNNPKSIISFDVMDSIYAYLYHESNTLDFKVKGIYDSVLVNLYTFPASLDHDEGRAEIKKAGFKNAYEVLNELYKKIGIGVLSEEIIQQELEYDFIHIQFYSEPGQEVKKYFKRVLNNFIIIFCCTDSLETNDFKILYSGSHFIDYTKGLLDAEFLDIDNPKNETQEIGLRDFKIVLQAICQYLNIEIAKDIELPSFENLIDQEEVTVEAFEEFVKLVSGNNVKQQEIKNHSKKLFVNYQKGPSEYHSIVEGHFDFFENIDAWNSDWKFDPEDAEYFISEMIGQDFNFDYPPDTYSHDLFPYIQNALAKLNLELLTYDTHGDNYLFFVVNASDVDEILKLSEITGIEINTL